MNSEQKSKWVHMSISLQSGAMGLQRLIYFNYFNVLKWKSRFSLELNAAKNMDYMRKRFK